MFSPYRISASLNRMNLFASESRNIRKHTGWGWALVLCCAICGGIGTLGCGIASSPHPPSLQLPKPIRNLNAARIGNSVHLSWTVPGKTTDGINLRGPVQLQIYRRLKTGVPYQVKVVSSEPDKPGFYVDRLPSTLVSGSLRPIFYYVVGVNRNGRSAGPSNTASALAGEGPPPVLNLSARMVERGVVLQWQSPGKQRPNTSILLSRTLLTGVATAPHHTERQLSLAHSDEPSQQLLQLTAQPGDIDPGMAMDINVKVDRKYRYTATRTRQLKIGDQWLRAASEPSIPIDIATRDTFPPAAPTGLAAVPVAASLNGGKIEVDLSWSVNTEPDLAGYLVYRSIVNVTPAGQASGAAEQIAPKDSSAPIVAPVFRDSHVEPGKSYKYSIVAIDHSGNRSERSSEVQTTIPQ